MSEDINVYYKLGEMHGDIKSVLAEAQKTNGRVTRLEGEVNKINLKIAYYSGGVSVIMYIISKLIDYIK